MMDEPKIWTKEDMADWPLYHSVQPVRALLADRDFIVMTPSGPVRAEQGYDYVMVSEGGRAWVIPKEVFEKQYVRMKVVDEQSQKS